MGECAPPFLLINLFFLCFFFCFSVDCLRPRQQLRHDKACQHSFSEPQAWTIHQHLAYLHPSVIHCFPLPLHTGLGKSLTSLAMLHMLFTYEREGRALVVVPSNVSATLIHKHNTDQYRLLCVVSCALDARYSAQEIISLVASRGGGGGGGGVEHACFNMFQHCMTACALS
jgi:hypothetical protein